MSTRDDVDLPNLSSPISSCTYKRRLIDFDRAEKSDLAPEATMDLQEDLIVRMLDGLPDGMILEPWD
jgi:hypothetical protein